MALFKKSRKNKENEEIKEEVLISQELTGDELDETEPDSSDKTELSDKKDPEKKEPEEKKSTEQVKEIIIREKIIDEGDFYDAPEDISEEELLNYNPDGEEDTDNIKKRKREEPKKKALRNGILISLAAVILCVALVFIFAGGSYSFKNALTNIQYWFMGTDAGDGYPVGLTGSDADKMGFFSENSNMYVLTDSSFTCASLSGEEIFSCRHSCSFPTVEYSSDKFIIYDMGNTSYLIGDKSGTTQKFTCDENINAADISKSGRYAVFTQSQDYVSELLVYNKENELIFTYKYAENYPVAVQMSPDGKKVCTVTVNENGGELYSVLSVFELDKTEPVAQYVSAANFITNLYWEGTTLFALGNCAAISCDAYNNFVEYEFEGSTVTASEYKNNKLIVSVSDYNYAGACILYIFDGSASNVKTLNFDERIEDISSFGGYISLLIKKNVYCYDIYTLTKVATGSAPYDTLSIAMANDAGAYSLGVTEINYIPLKYTEN